MRAKEKIEAHRPLCLRGKYRGEGNTFHAASKTLEHFLTERYCLYSADADGTLKRGDIHHLPWNLQVAQAEISENSMTKGLGLDFGNAGIVAFFAPARCGGVAAAARVDCRLRH